LSFLSYFLGGSPTYSGASAPPTSPEEVLSSKGRSGEVYTQVRQNPLQAVYGRIINTDPTLAKFAGGESFDFYYRIRRQISAIGGIVGQLVDGALKRRPIIVAGDQSDEESVNVANDIRRIWDDIPGKSVALRKAVDTLVTCGFAPLEMVWGRDAQTQIVAPVGEIRKDGSRGPGLIDRPARNFIFDTDQNPRFLSVIDPFMGEPIEPMKFIFLRAGSLNSPYGESEFTELHSSAWLYMQIQQFGLDAVEKYGRPIPHVLIPRTMDAADVAALDTFYTEKFGTYTRALYDGTEVKVEYPSMSLASAGAAGRSEIEWMRFIHTQMYIRLLRTPQTQDKTGGSRALESTRQSITDLATLTYSDILCEGLQEGWMRPVMEINYPDLDPKLRPRIVPDYSAAEDRNTKHKRIIDGLDRGIAFSKEWYYREFDAQEAKDADDVLGHPKTTITENNTPPTAADPNADPANQNDGDPEDQQDGGADDATEPGAEGWVGVTTSTGETLYFDPRYPVFTANRGPVPFDKLTHGDEPITLTKKEE
jgi:hypothetical protein